MLSLLFVLALMAVLVGMGWPAMRWLDSGGRVGTGERLLFSFAIGCFAIYFGVSTVGHFRFDAISMWSLVGVCAVAAIPGWHHIPWCGFAATVKQEIAAVRSDRWLLLLWLALILIGLSSIIQGLAPPNDYDSLLYHLAQPQYELESGRLGIPWDRRIANMFFPKLAGNFTRLGLATMGDGAAQMMLGMFGLVAAAAAAAIAFRLQLSKYAALLAGVLFLSVRAVVWEMATVEVDVALAAFYAVAALAYFIWREKGEIGLGFLFGLLIGGGILVKLYGFPVAASFAPLMLYDLIKRRMRLVPLSLAPAAALVVIVPHLTHNYLITGNPLFPAANWIFNPGKPEFFAGATSGFGTGRGLDDLLLGPWHIFVSPMEYFDGMIFGAPYLLVLCPLLLLSFGGSKRWLPLITITATYYLIWFYIGAQQVRFLIAITPFLALLAAAGAVTMWDRTSGAPFRRSAFVAVMVVLGLNQAIFVGIYSMLRLPVAVGLMDASTYHGKTPSMDGALFKTCDYIRQNLKPGETYFSMAGLHSYYCPQVSATHTYFADEAKWWLDSKSPPVMSINNFIQRAEDAKFRYFIFTRFAQNRRNRTARQFRSPVDLSARRFGKYFAPVVNNLAPLVEGPYTAVYDGPAFLSGLKALNKEN